MHNRPLGVTFAHAESFRPAYAASPWSFRLDDKDLLYWDDKACVTIFVPKTAAKDDVAKPPSTDVDADAEAFLAMFEDATPAEAAPTKGPETTTTKADEIAASERELPKAPPVGANGAPPASQTLETPVGGVHQPNPVVAAAHDPE